MKLHHYDGLEFRLGIKLSIGLGWARGIKSNKYLGMRVVIGWVVLTEFIVELLHYFKGKLHKTPLYYWGCCALHY